VAFLEQSPPSPAEVLRAMPSGTVVVPLLLTNAFHASIDLPAQWAGFDCVLAETLGAPSELLLTALAKRLPATTGFDGLVLAAAGTRASDARAGIEDVASALSARHSVPCRVAYAAGVPPTGGGAVGGPRTPGGRPIPRGGDMHAPGPRDRKVGSSAR
jgi:sirohydrochlorin ferrochelatase